MPDHRAYSPFSLEDLALVGSRIDSATRVLAFRALLVVALGEQGALGGYGLLDDVTELLEHVHPAAKA